MHCVRRLRWSELLKRSLYSILSARDTHAASTCDSRDHTVARSRTVSWSLKVSFPFFSSSWELQACSQGTSTLHIMPFYRFALEWACLCRTRAVSIILDSIGARTSSVPIKVNFCLLGSLIAGTWCTSTMYETSQVTKCWAWPHSCSRASSIYFLHHCVSLIHPCRAHRSLVKTQLHKTNPSPPCE